MMMLGIGVWYLGFGTRWITWYRGEEESRPTGSFKHLITGVQVEPPVVVLTTDWSSGSVNDIDPNHSNSTSKQERFGLWKPNFRLVRPRYGS